MNKQLMLSCLELSAEAYQDIQPRCDGDRVLMVDDHSTGVQYSVRMSPGGLMTIAFRGTDSKRDWASNFMFGKKAIPYDNAASRIRVHEGFLNAYKSPAVRERIQGMITGKVRRLRITGHSRGAALAILCAVDLNYNFPDRCIEAVVFGCPRVGNAAFAKSYNRRVFSTLRVDNGGDVVAHVPPWLMGYRHVGVRVHVGRPGFPFFSALDHEPRRYYQSLFKQLHC